MSYEELINQIPGLINKLNVDEEFKENPAYASYIVEVKKEIEELGLMGNTQINVITQSDGFGFAYKTPIEEGKIVITKSKGTELICIKAAQKNLGFSSRLGRDLRTKSVTEIVGRIKDDREVIITNNEIMLSDINPETKDVESRLTATTMKYTNRGVMFNKEKQTFLDIINDIKPFDVYKTDDLLEYLDPLFVRAKQDLRTELISYTRNTIDTARVVYQNRTDGSRYSSIVELDKHHSLRNINPAQSVKKILESDEDIEIFEMSESEIESLRLREPNELVKEGLKEFAKRRIGYFYVIKDDPYYDKSLGLRTRGRS